MHDKDRQLTKILIKKNLTSDKQIKNWINKDYLKNVKYVLSFKIGYEWFETLLMHFWFFFFF